MLHYPKLFGRRRLGYPSIITRHARNADYLAMLASLCPSGVEVAASATGDDLVQRCMAALSR